MSKLAAGLLQSWCDGTLSASELQRHMESEVDDQRAMRQRAHPMVERLRGIGPDQNAQRGLRELLGGLGLLRMQTTLEVVDNVDTMVLPSTVIRLLHTHYPRDFKVLLGADPDKLRVFWTSFFGRPRSAAWAQRHAALRNKTAADLVCTVPCVVHTDAGPCTKLKSANTLSWSSLLGSGGEKNSKFLSCSCVKAETHGDRPSWERLLGDFAELTTGLVGGEEVARDRRRLWRFVLLAAKADAEVRCNEWGLPHFGAEENCSDCLCSTNADARPFTDLQVGAAWRPTEAMSFEGWFARIRRPLHPLLESDVVCDRWSIFCELMHLTDCNGVSSIVYGGILGLLLEERRLGPTVADRMACVNEFMSRWYSEHTGVHKLPKLRKNNLTSSGGWWELSGPAIKAASMRAAAPLFAAVANEFLVRELPRHQQARRLAELLEAFYTVVYGAPMFPSDADVERTRTIVNEFGQIMMLLREDSRARNKLYFKISPKVHGMMHVPMYMGVLNPRWLQAYLEEGLAGSVTKIWQKAMRGRYDREIQSNILLRRYVGLLLRLES